MTEFDATTTAGTPLAEDPAYRDVIDFMKEVFQQTGDIRPINEQLVDGILENDAELIVAIKTIAAEELAGESVESLLSVVQPHQKIRRSGSRELASTKPRGVIKALGSAGMEQLRITDNSHTTFRNPENGRITHVGRHGRELGSKTVGSMLSQLGLSREQYLNVA